MLISQMAWISQIERIKRMMLILQMALITQIPQIERIKRIALISRMILITQITQINTNDKTIFKRFTSCALH